MSKELVESIKADLVANGVNLSGPCGAFEIVKRVAWALRHEGYGLYGGKNPAQNGCTVGNDRYSVDWILLPNGQGRDILGDAGGENNPQWGHLEQDNPGAWRPAIDPGDVPVPDPQPAPDPEPVPPPVDLEPLWHAIAILAEEITKLRTQVETLENKPLPDYKGTGRVFWKDFEVISKPIQ